MVIIIGLVVIHKHLITIGKQKTLMITFSVGIVANLTIRLLSVGMVLMLFVIIVMNPAIRPRYVDFRLLAKKRVPKRLATLKR